MNYRWTTAVLITGLLVSQSACAEGRKISRTELPPTVEKTFKDQSEGAKVERLSEELENGQIYYKAKMRVEGHHKDVVINSAGDVERVGEQVAVNDLPPAVKAGIKARRASLAESPEWNPSLKGTSSPPMKPTSKNPYSSGPLDLVC